MMASVVNSQATESAAPSWLKGAGRAHSRCSKCNAKVHVSGKPAHEQSCWAAPVKEPAMRASLFMSDSVCFEYSDVERRPLELDTSVVFSSDVERRPLEMDNSTVFFSDVEEVAADEPKQSVFSYTTEDVASFVCTMSQTLENTNNGLKPYTHEFSTEDASAAIEWHHKELGPGGHFDTEDRPTGKYIKAYFTAEYDKYQDNWREVQGILIHDVLTTLQTYGVDITSVRHITDVCEDVHLVYVVLPDYCTENVDFYSFQYAHDIETEDDLIGFVRKGTPILTKEMCDLIDDAVAENKRFDCNELLVRRFLYANKEKLINGGTFTIKDMEDAGIIDIYKRIYPTDKKNIVLGRTIGYYCEVKSQANNKVPSNQRRKYVLKKDMIESLSK